MQFMFLFAGENFHLFACEENFYEFISKISGWMEFSYFLFLLTSGFRGSEQFSIKDFTMW